jgi:hypothetical protein
VVLPVAGVVGGAVQVGRGIANQSEALREKKAGKIWNKVRVLTRWRLHEVAGGLSDRAWCKVLCCSVVKTDFAH